VRSSTIAALAAPINKPKNRGGRSRCPSPYSLSSPLLLTHAEAAEHPRRRVDVRGRGDGGGPLHFEPERKLSELLHRDGDEHAREDFNSFTDAAHEGGDSSSSASCRSCSSEMVANMPGRTSTPPPMSRPRPAVGRRSVGRRRSPQQRKGDGLGAKHGGRSTGELEMGR
jgi:hypothetical protein